MSIEIISDITLFFGLAPLALVTNQIAMQYATNEEPDEESALLWTGVGAGLLALQFFSMAIHTLISYL